MIYKQSSEIGIDYTITMMPFHMEPGNRGHVMIMTERFVQGIFDRFGNGWAV